MSPWLHSYGSLISGNSDMRSSLVVTGRSLGNTVVLVKTKEFRDGNLALKPTLTLQEILWVPEIVRLFPIFLVNNFSMCCPRAIKPPVSYVRYHR